MSRSRSSARLMAGWLKKFRFAARVTWRSSNSAWSGCRRFRSRFRKCTSRMGGILTMHVANGTRRYLNKCERTWANWKAKIRRKIVTRTAIVTGASRGIGAAVAERLAQDGFSAVVNYAGSEAEASALAKKIQHGGGRAITVKADVSKPVEVARMFDATEKEFGGVDVLVNNAGIMTLSS